MDFPALLPVVIPGGECQILVISDDTVDCGQGPISDGVATLFFDGFSPVDVSLPIAAIGP